MLCLLACQQQQFWAWPPKTRRKTEPKKPEAEKKLRKKLRKSLKKRKRKRKARGRFRERLKRKLKPWQARGVLPLLIHDLLLLTDIFCKHTWMHGL